ncbi:MAG: hypothetical protein KIT72_18060 [Polyangiaceae bacterium]|nr:hypothetical protein [Polyangiaceae bacterium]MCW5792321.1 hypothetical protein [Polyangiaceae bacterium]
MSSDPDLPAPKARPDLEAQPDRERDPDLEALPPPRRPYRRLTLTVMSITLLASLGLGALLMSHAAYALATPEPVSIGSLERFTPEPRWANVYVQGEGTLSARGLRYMRPLSSDSYRLVQVEKNPNLWVEVRVPEEMDTPYFLPPTSFVGRLVPLEEAGIGHAGLEQIVADHGRKPEGAWLLIDGASPAGTRWALALVGLCFAFAAFNGFGLYRVWRPIKLNSPLRQAVGEG